MVRLEISQAYRVVKTVLKVLHYIKYVSLRDWLIACNIHKQVWRTREDLNQPFAKLCISGAPERTWTSNPRLRRPMLYPVELRALFYWR